MLDFGLGEILLLGAVALIVLGPEKLPHAARMAGAWYGRIRRTLATMQAEIEHEINLAEIRQRMNDELGSIREVQRDVHTTLTNQMYELKNPIYPNTSFSPNDTNAAINSPETDWSHGIEAPLKPYANGYYFFFVPSSMYATLIPSAPHLPKSIIVQNTRHPAKATVTEYPIDVAPL